MPIECEKCPSARNCVNGRYCTRRGVYVEHDTKLKCKNET